MLKKSILLTLVIIFVNLATNVFAQDNSRVAVLPFSAVEVSESEARVVTSLFETALVKTGVYNVIEQNQINEILDAQAFSLSGCTDDACAVEVGKLLSAEFIILGELSSVGERYIANAKLINVEEGKNINADSVTADTIAMMTDQAINLLAYKLAGLTYNGSSGQQVANAFGEIYVSTKPDGADIYINGIKRGVSPLVIEKVPVGEVRLSARKDNLAGEKMITLTSSDLIEVNLELKVSLGRLFIKSAEKNVNVYLDEKKLGPLGDGIFRDIVLGEHELKLQGDWLLWHDTIKIENEKTTTVDAWLSPYGILKYELPEDAACELTGPDGTISVSGEGEKELSIGSYSLEVSGENYKPYKDVLEVAKGSTVNFLPALKYTEQYSLSLGEDKMIEIKTGLETRASEIEEKLETENTSSNDSLIELDETRALITSTKTCGYDFPELEKRKISFYQKPYRCI